MRRKIRWRILFIKKKGKETNIKRFTCLHIIIILVYLYLDIKIRITRARFNASFARDGPDCFSARTCPYRWGTWTSAPRRTRTSDVATATWRRHRCDCIWDRHVFSWVSSFRNPPMTAVVVRTVGGPCCTRTLCAASARPSERRSGCNRGRDTYEDPFLRPCRRRSWSSSAAAWWTWPCARSTATWVPSSWPNCRQHLWIKRNRDVVQHRLGTGFGGLWSARATPLSLIYQCAFCFLLLVLCIFLA